MEDERATGQQEVSHHLPKYGTTRPGNFECPAPPITILYIIVNIL